MKKYRTTFKLVFFTGLFFFFSGIFMQEASAEILEIGEVRSLGTEVKVPVTLYDFTYLKNLNVEIDIETGQEGVSLIGFETANPFESSQFRTVKNVEGSKLKIDVISRTGSEVKVEKRMILGYITYRLTSSFEDGTAIKLPIGNIVANGRYGNDIIVSPLGGKIERKMPVGDVVGKNKPTAAAAMRILQHVRGNLITNKEEFLSADVDGDNVITQNDAQQILDYVSGKRVSFLAIQAKELDTAVLKSEYVDKVTAVHGRAPYKYTRSGTLPSGITLDATTGELSGTPKIAGSYSFTVKVTDAVGNEAERIFKMEVIDSNISSVEKLLPITVQLNAQPALPSEVTVTYSDKKTGKEKVSWEPVDTSVIGTTVAKGKLAGGFTVTVDINVVHADYVKDIQIDYMEFVNLHTIYINASAEVYSITVDNIPMHYEGNELFSLGTNDLLHGKTVVIQLNDKFGNVLELKQIALQ
ncbi:putative Ig domain-containing protein [Sporosarcina sp. SAFN-015]|uniref:putative Ig domain-containing protein n=1 Tax=Sporosarcina sp. SAFN-015 TaxID=3387274 RepID=UPI003F7D428D